MGKVTSCHFRLAQLFPPNDEYATTVARLCILWEDFMTEASGGTAERLPAMDSNSVRWRRLYFLRRSIGTIQEIRQGFDQLCKQKNFKSAHKKQPTTDRNSFDKSRKKLGKHAEKLKELRNRIGGGHVKEDAVKEGLAKMDCEKIGMLQEGEYYKDIRYKFADELVLAALFPGHKDAEKELGDLISSMLDESTDSALKMIEYAFHLYMKERRITGL